MARRNDDGTSKPDRGFQGRSPDPSDRHRSAYELLIASSPDGYALLDRDLVFLEVNPMYARYWGKDASQMVGRAAADVVGHEFFDRGPRQRIEACFQGVSQMSEVTLDTPGLGLRHAEVLYAPCRAPDGSITAAAVSVRDVTARHVAEASLRESEARLSAIFHHSPVGIVFTRMSDGLILDANDAFAELFGCSVADVVGHSSAELGLWANPHEREALARGLDEHGVVRDFDVTARGPNGELRTLRVSVEKLVLDDDSYTLAIAEDFSERRRMERALREREQLLREVGRSARIGGFEFDPVTGEGTWTEDVARIHDIDPTLPIDVSQGIAYYQGESRLRIEAAVKNAVEHAQPYDLELEIRSAKGVHKWIRTIGHPVVENGKVVKVWGSVQDITEQKQVEAQLRASQKMEAIGTLAGGVAHDFNNLLVVILNSTQFALDTLPPNAPQRRELVEVQKAGERAATLTRQLLAFGRKQLLQPVALDLNRVVRGLEPMLRRIIGEDIEFRLELAAGLGTVMADPGQLEQVLMNLVVNARDAMPEGGRLTVATSNLELDESNPQRHAEVRPGPYVQLEVTDTGGGMNETTRARLFEPFYTTKPTGKGTGLGLSMTYGIVKQSGGYIWVESSPGCGATFRIQLPRELAASVAVPRGGSGSARVTGSETVLVVEDEEALRTIAQRFLEAAGYRVLAAADRDEAIAACEAAAGGVRLLLTDVVMPKVSGRRLAQELTARWPGMRVIYMSGYTDDAIAHHGVIEPGTHFLAKPFKSADLLQKVRAALDAAGS